MNERLRNTLLMIKSFANFKRANCDYKSDHDSSKRTFFLFFAVWNKRRGAGSVGEFSTTERAPD